MRPNEIKRATKKELKNFFGQVLEGFIALNDREMINIVTKMDRESVEGLRSNAILILAHLDRGDEEDRFGTEGWRHTILGED